MANDHKRRDGKTPPTEKGISDETVMEIRDAILRGVGYKNPPRHTQFKKGQSGNPKGRPRAVDPGPGGSRSGDAITLREGERLIRVREGTETREMPAIDAVHRKQIATALGGNAHAQKHVIDRHARAELERRREIAKEIELFSLYAETIRAEIDAAEANGLPVPDPLLHPDDMIMDPETGVRFVGPLTEEGRDMIKEHARLRDVLIMQHALEWRLTEVDSPDPLDGPGSALAFAHTINASLPQRYQLSEAMFVTLTRRYDTWSKRKLLKEVYRAWRGLGVRVPRGRTLPSLRFAKEAIEGIVEFLTAGGDKAVARVAAQPVHTQIDAIGLARRKVGEGQE